MKEKMTLECEQTCLARADVEDGYEYVELYRFWFPWDSPDFSTHSFYIVRHRIMDFDDRCWDKIYNGLRGAMKAFGAEVNRKYRCYDGSEERVYKKPEYYEEWKYYMDELAPDDQHCVRSSSTGDYGPGNPWNAPGMKVSDFIRGVY